MPRKNARDKIIDRIPQAHTTRGLTLGATVVGVPPPSTPSDVLRADGSVPLVGALTVSAGVTIDGVDISAHAAAPDAHHAALVGLAADSGTTTPDENDQITLVGGNGLSSSASGSAVTLQLDTPLTISATSLNMAGAGHSHAVQGSSAPGATMSLLTTSASGGLTLGSSTLVVDAAAGRVGIGMVPSAARLDITGAVNEAALRVTTSATTAHAIVLSAPSLTSGSLLAATLPADRPVIQASVSGDTHARLTLLPTGMLLGSGSATPDVMMRRGGAQHLIIDNNALGGAVDLSVSRRITAGATTPGPALINSIWPGGAQLRLGYDATNFMDFYIDNGGSLTMAPTGDIIFNPLGNDVAPLYGYKTNLGSVGKKFLSIWGVELNVESLVAQDTTVTTGGRILIAPATVYVADLAPSGGGGTTSPPTFVGKSTYATANASSSVSQYPPSETVAGNLMLAHLTSRADNQTVSTPAGWTLVPDSTKRDTSTTPDGDSFVFYRVAGSNEPATLYTFTGTVAGTLGVVISAWAGVDPSNPINASGSQTNVQANAITGPSVTTTMENTTLVLLASGATTKAITPPASMTEQYEYSGGTTTVNGWGASEGVAGVGATGTRAATYTDGSARASMGTTIALAPTPAVSGSSSIQTKHNQMQAGDIAYSESFGKVEFLQIASSPTGTGPYTYDVIRDLDGTGANTWLQGDALVNTGQAGSGFIDLYSLHGVNGQLFDSLFVYDNAGSAAPYEAGSYGVNVAQEVSWQIFPNAPLEVGDAVYFGCAGIWNNIYLNLSVLASWSGTGGVFEYWNGSAWASFSPALIGSVSSGGSFGAEWVLGSLPGWASKTINGVSEYWVRWRIVTPGIVTTLPRQGRRRAYWRKRTFGPTIASNVRNSSAYWDFEPRSVFGNLEGVYDYSKPTFGFAAGRYGGPSGVSPWLSVDEENGIRVMRGATKLGQWDTLAQVLIGQTGAGQGNVWIDSGGVRLRTAMTPKIDAQTDGDLQVGSNTLNPATTFLSIFSNAQTYNGEAMAAGDVLLGDNSAFKANLKWTPSDGFLRFRGGTTTQMYLDTAGQLIIGPALIVANSSGMKLKTQINTVAGSSTFSQLWWSSTNGSTTSAFIGGGSYPGFMELLLQAGGSDGTSGTIEMAAYSSTTRRSRVRARYDGVWIWAQSDPAHTISLDAKTIRLNNFYQAGMGSPEYGTVYISGSLSVGSNAQPDPVGTKNMALEGNLFAGGAIYPGLQTNYYLGYGGNMWGTGNNGMYTNDALGVAGSVLCANWFRSIGNNGWFSQTHGGGIHQTTAGYIETYGATGLKVGGLASIRTPPVAEHSLTINGIGTTSATYGLVVRNSSGANRMFIRDDGLGNWVSTNWNVGSDARFKRDIQPIPSSLAETASSIPIRTYKRLQSERQEIGFIGQEVINSHPDQVSVDMDGNLAVNYIEILLAKVANLERAVYKK